MARAFLLFFLACEAYAGSEAPPPSPDRPWRTMVGKELQAEVATYQPPALPLEPGKNYSLDELIDLAETFNPDTRVACGRP